MTSSSPQAPAETPISDVESDLRALEVRWDLDPLLDGAANANALLDEADELVSTLEQSRGAIASFGADELVEFMSSLARLNELVSRAGHFEMLHFSINTADPEIGARMQTVTERSTALGTRLIFFDLEWAAVDEQKVAELLADERLSFCRRHLENLRRYRPYQLGEPEERIMAEKALVASQAWGRLFQEDIAAITVDIEGESSPLEMGLGQLSDADRTVRQAAQQAVTDGLAPTLRMRASIFNTLLLDKSIDDRLRGFPTWVSSRNLENEATDDSVQALVDAVVRRYDIPQRWYRMKAQALGLERLSDYDRMASVASSSPKVGWEEGSEIVRSAYGSFSAELEGIVSEFMNNPWIDAPSQAGKSGGAFCAYTVPQLHPYVMLNWASEHRDVLTLAHELGHGAHAYLAREQGIFHQTTPLTLAETASVFGETVTSRRLLATMTDEGDRFALLASMMDDAVATVFRQIAMNRFEHAIHTERRTVGELSVARFGELWRATQTDMMGDSVELTDNYTSWWSYVSHFVAVPGYVYAYAYGQLLALSVYARFEVEGENFVPSYLDMLRAGGSKSPEELGRIVGCDLADPGFWDAGLNIIERQLDEAEQAGKAAGRL